MARSDPTSYGYKVTTRIIPIQQLVREAEGADWDLPTYIYEFNKGQRRFVVYDPNTYEWVDE